MALSPLIVKAAAALLTSEKGRKGVGFLLVAISLRMTSMKNTSHLIRSVMKCMRRMEILEIRERQFMLAVDKKFYLF